MPYHRRTLRIAALAALSATAPLPGCITMFVGSNAELDDDSIQRAQAKDTEARNRRMRESNSVRPAEYEAINGKLGGGEGGAIAPKPTIEELERRTQQR